MRIRILFFAFIVLTIPSPAQDAEIQKIKANIKAFSQAYMNADYDNIANAYTVDGRILPPGPTIIEGREAIKARWIMPEGTRIVHHEVTPEEIRIIGDYAYDVGYYEGKTQRQDGEEVSWRGKYLIVWKKVENDWKIHIDAWNRVAD